MCDFLKRQQLCGECETSPIEICKHNREKKECKTCRYYCEHSKHKYTCRLCGGSSFCEHNKFKSICRICGGSAFCEHKKQKTDCRLCGGSAICEHNKRKTTCRLCGGSAICEHNKVKARCRICGGSAFCEHNKRKTTCRLCSGSAICEHNKFKAQCRLCGWSAFCEHNKFKKICRLCSGSAICEHSKETSRCQICEPIKYLVNLQRSSIYRIMNQNNLEKTQPSIEYLCCSTVYFKEYISKKMTADMTFENIHYDHIKPVSVFNLDDPDELLKCCHYTNFQPLLATDNLEKHNKWNEECEAFWTANICGKEYFEIYNPF